MSIRIGPSELFKFFFDASVHLHSIADLLLPDRAGVVKRRFVSVFGSRPGKLLRISFCVFTRQSLSRHGC